MNWFDLAKEQLRRWKAQEGDSRESYGNFTPRAQQALALARTEATRLNHNFVGTEHLLLGLTKLGQGVAVIVLGRMGVNLETARAEIEKMVGAGPDQKIIGNIPYTPRVKKVLALADKERRALNHTYLGTEHVLLGILREGDGVAGRVLNNLGVDIEQTRQEILRELDPNFSPSSGTANPSPSNEPASIPAKVETPQNLGTTELQRRLVDISKRFDVYCSERNQEVVVYRNVLFKGVRRLFADHQDTLSDFFELEHVDGQTIFVSKYSVIKFCGPGVPPNAENIPGDQA